MDADALAALGGLINAIKSAKADGSEPGTVFAWIEGDLRARMPTCGADCSRVSCGSPLR